MSFPFQLEMCATDATQKVSNCQDLMPDIAAPEKDREVRAFLDRRFPSAGRTILEQANLDISRPNLHDSKKDFQEERRFVDRSAEDLFALYTGMMNQGEQSIEAARGIPMDFVLKARQRNKSETTPETPVALILQNVRGVDYWGFSKQFVFDLYLTFSARKSDLEEQRDLFWSTQGRPPDHYARIMALRLAKLFAKHFKRLPTAGTASDGDHPSTEYGRLLQELFELLQIETSFRLPSEWAVARMSEDDLPKVDMRKIDPAGLMPNLMNWTKQKATD